MKLTNVLELPDKSRPAFNNGRYHSYGEFLKEKFAGRVHKIPVNAGFTCPNRDGTVAFGGCTYCNIDSFTPEAARVRTPIRTQIEDSIGYLKQRFKANSFIVYFQPYTNTYADLPRLKALYEEALDHPDIVGISVGTRPDCIDDEKLDFFEELAHDYFVTLEYGIESAWDETLALINRGHNFECTEAGITSTAKRAALHVCGHVIFGFPNETRQQMIETVNQVSQLPLDFIKIHNLHVVRHTELATQYRAEAFPVFSFEDWIQFACEIIERLNPNFVIERLYGDAPMHLLVAPKWCKEKSAAQVIYAIQQRLEVLDSYQGKYFGRNDSATKFRIPKG